MKNPPARMWSVTSPPSMEQAFVEQRPRLRRLAMGMLGSAADADDALQDTWIRASGVDAATIENPAGWLTTVTVRVCLNMLRARKSRHEDPTATPPEPGATRPPSDPDPLQEAVVAETVGMALLVVLDTLSPAERVAFVLHDVFAVPFEEIAPMVDRSVESTRQLASRARRRVRPGSGATIEATSDPNPNARRQLVDAFFNAARSGDLDALVAVLHPAVVLTLNRGLSDEVIVEGAATVAARARMFANPAATLAPVVVDHHVGVLVEIAGRLGALMIFVVSDESIVAIETTTDPTRLELVQRIS